AMLENFADDIWREQAGVFGEETKDDAIEKTGDAKVFALRDGMLAPGLRVGQLYRFSILQRTRDIADLRCELFGNFGRRALRFEKIRILEDGTKQREDLRTVDIRLRELVRLLHGA